MGWRRGADGAWPGRGEGSGVGGTVVPCSVPTYSPKLGWDGPRMAPLCPPPWGWGQPSPHQHPKPRSDRDAARGRAPLTHEDGAARGQLSHGGGGGIRG